MPVSHAGFVCCARCRNEAVAAALRAEIRNVPRGTYFHEPRILFSCAMTDNSFSRWTARRAHHPRSLLDDAGLFAGNLFNRMTEKILVIEINLRDHRDLRHDYV